MIILLLIVFTCSKRIAIEWYISMQVNHNEISKNIFMEITANTFHRSILVIIQLAANTNINLLKLDIEITVT